MIAINSAITTELFIQSIWSRCYSYFLLTYILLLITRSHFSITQARRLNTRMFTYATPIFMTEALRLVTQVKLFLTTVTVN